MQMSQQTSPVDFAMRLLERYFSTVHQRRQAHSLKRPPDHRERAAAESEEGQRRDKTTRPQRNKARGQALPPTVLAKAAAGRSATWGSTAGSQGGQEKQEPVFVVATGNDVRRLPPELLRKGRFDEIFWVDLPDIHERESIFTIHLQRRGRAAEDFDCWALAEVAEKFSGAEIEQSIVDAIAAATRLIITTTPRHHHHATLLSRRALS